MIANALLYLWVMHKGFFVIDAATSTSSFPLTVKCFLVPSLRQREQRRVHLPTDAHIREPVSPVMKLHPLVVMQIGNIV